MKLYNIKNIDNFCDIINNCKGDISLVAKDGSKVDLKSKLNQYVALSQFFGAESIPEIEILAQKPEDVLVITRYLMSA